MKTRLATFTKFGRRYLELYFQNLFYRVKIINGKLTNDRWDELLNKTIHRHDEHYDQFAFFDDQVLMSEEKLVVVSDNSVRREGDALKQIFEKEFSPRNQSNESSAKLIQKPPRKSLELKRLSMEINGSNYSSRNSMRFDD